MENLPEETGKTPLTHRLGWMVYYKNGHTPVQVVRQFGISRKTFYKWLKRYKAGEGVLDRSRRPHHFPRATPKETVDLLIAEKNRTGYGQRRLKRHMETVFCIRISERTIWKLIAKNRAVSSVG